MTNLVLQWILVISPKLYGKVLRKLDLVLPANMWLAAIIHPGTWKEILKQMS